MNNEGHNIIGMIALGIFFAIGLGSTIGGSANQLLFVLSFIIFTTSLSPDIDLKIPYVGHRGITHNHLGTVLVGLIIGGLGFLAFTQFGISELAPLIPVIIGAMLAWILHQITDSVYDRIRAMTWIIVAIICIGVYWYISGGKGL